MKWKAAKTSAVLCLVFLVVYGVSNRLTALRHDVGTIYFAWERHIPFVPLMIVPYMSIDLFFMAAPFLCRDDRERRILSNRIIAVILIAGCCFMLFPLRFAFRRPEVDGVLGVVFNNFRNLDQPFNQFPSLHIALQIILLIFYAGHTRGIARATLCAWFVLIGLSTLLTYQHHVIDVVGGFALGVLSVYLFQEESLCQEVTRNVRAGMCYLFGSISLVGLALVFRPWGMILIWPAMSLSLVAAAYFRLGAGIYHKRRGTVPFITRLMLWPVLLGHRISLVYYASRSEPWNSVDDRFWIGRRLSSEEADLAIRRGVTAVLDLASELSEARPFLSVNYCELQVLDLTAPTQAHLDQAVAFIRAKAERGIVYVHCKAGYSRTAAVAGAYLLETGKATCVEEAAAMLRAARPQIVIRPEVVRALRIYANRLTVTVTPSPAFAFAPSPTVRQP